MIAIIDYGAGNLKSVEKAFTAIGETCVITREYEKLKEADRILLPGVGSFGSAMAQIKRFSLDKIMEEMIFEKKKPFLGICLGLQLLYEGSEESKGVEGLGFLKGKILRIPDAEGLKIPHVGWNSLQLQNDGKLFRGFEKEPYVYFVHSYYLQASEEETVKATTEYGVTIHASVEKDNLFACQFHPEKSGEVGLSILRHFLKA